MRKFDFAAISQVGELLVYYRAHNHFLDIHLLVSSMSELDRFSNEISMLETAGITIHIYKDRAFLHRKLARRQASSIRNILRRITSESPDHFIVHTRNVLVSSFFRSAVKHNDALKILPVLVDFRGTEWAEYLLFTHNRIPFAHEIIDGIETRELLLVEREAYTSCNAASSVSEDFDTYLAMMWGERDNTHVIPCLANTDTFHYDARLRQAFRLEQGMESSDIVILFSTGGASPWQNIEPVIESFSRLLNTCKTLQDRLKLYILTPAAKQLTSTQRNVVITSAPHYEMHKWLNASDICTIFRDDNVVNHVASPIKVSEYLCCGLPVIANSGVRMMTRWIKNHGHGAVVDSLDQLTEKTLVELTELDRDEISRIATTHFGLPEIASRYLSVYASMANN